MRKRALLTTAAGLAAWAAWSSTAAAATVPSAVEIRGFGYDLNSGAMNGIVESPRAACLRNRTVRMWTVTDGVRRALSVDRSSDNGFWGGSGTVDPSEPPTFHARMKPKRLGPTRRCAGDSDVRTPGGGKGAFRRVIYPTGIGIGGAAIGETVLIDGKVTAREACRKNRRVRIVAVTPGGNFRVDVDRASDNGFFGGGGQPPEPATGARVIAPEKRLGPGKRCAGAIAGVDS